jgi:hypothetical protein
VTGRRSGVRYTIPVGYRRRGDVLDALVSKAPTKQWWRNYRAHGLTDAQWKRAAANAALVEIALEA